MRQSTRVQREKDLNGMVSEGLLGCFSCLFWVKSFCKTQHSMRNWGSKKRYSEETAISEKQNSKYKATKAGTNLDYSLKNIYILVCLERKTGSKPWNALKVRVKNLHVREARHSKFNGKLLEMFKLGHHNLVYVNCVADFKCLVNGPQETRVETK